MSTAQRADWLRVTKDRPCPICKKPDWCMVSADGTAAICQRVPEGSIKQVGDAGSLHRVGDQQPGWRRIDRKTWTIVSEPTRPAAMKWAELARVYREAVDPKRLAIQAEKLGLSVESLQRLGVGWCKQSLAWSFPMTNRAGQVLGIRLRQGNGNKFAVKGGHEGLFIPSDLHTWPQLLIAEGPTDTAALLDLGFAAVGRPSCVGGTDLLTELVKRCGTIAVTVVSDNDGHGAGQTGARRLAMRLALYNQNVRLISPPDGVKDARAWKAAGATADSVQERIDAAPVIEIKVVASMAEPYHRSRRRSDNG
jgi:hypothetical protein